MSLNVFCSCGASGGASHINLPDHLCLLDKTWHTGFDFPPLSFEKFFHPENSGELSQMNSAVTIVLRTNNAFSCLYILGLLTQDEFHYMQTSLIFIVNLCREVFTQTQIFLCSENWTHAPVSPQPILRRSSLFFSLLFCLLSSP